MKAHISVANMLVLATTSHGMALREGIEEKKDTSNIDGVRMDSSAKVIKSNPVSSRNLMNHQSHYSYNYPVGTDELMDYGNIYSVPHDEFEGEDTLIPHSYHHNDLHNVQAVKENNEWEMYEYLLRQHQAPPQAQVHHQQYPRLPSGQQLYSQHSSTHQNHLPLAIASPYDKPENGAPARGYTAPLPGPPHTHQRAPPMLPYKPYQPERGSEGPSSSAVDADSDASDSSDESGNDSDHNSGSHSDEIENHSDLASGSRSGEIDDHRSIMARPNHEEPENDSDDAAESDSDPSKRDKKPSRFKMIQNVVTKAGGKAKKGLTTNLSSLKRLSFKKSE